MPQNTQMIAGIALLGFAACYWVAWVTTRVRVLAREHREKTRRWFPRGTFGDLRPGRVLYPATIPRIDAFMCGLEKTITECPLPGR